MIPLSDDRNSAPTPGRVKAWTGWLDEDGDPAHGYAVFPTAEWTEKWAPPCPDGHPQRLRHALGFRERNARELELRVALGGDDAGVCQVIVEEHEHEVHVRVLVDQEPEGARRDRSGYTDYPVRAWLDKPLAGRIVIDVDSDQELPLFVPSHRNNVPLPDHGYHPVNRRRQRHQT